MMVGGPVSTRSGKLHFHAPIGALGRPNLCSLLFHSLSNVHALHSRYFVCSLS